jgi:hypothetical protein
MPNQIASIINPNNTIPFSPGPGINAPTANDIPNLTIAPNNTTRQASPGPGVNLEHPVGVEASNYAPGTGVATSSTVEVGPSSSANPNVLKGGDDKPGVGTEYDGTVEVGPASQNADAAIRGGLLSPSHVPMDVVPGARINDQNFVVGVPMNVILGAPGVR